MRKGLKQIYILTLVGTLTITLPASAQLLINEFSAMNNRIMIDSMTKDYSDWIEIENISERTINLEGYYLSDDPDQLLKYKIPEEIMIKPGHQFIFIANGKGSSNQLNFKLSVDGEFILLSESEGNIIDSVQYQDQQAGISMGRHPEQKDKWLYFYKPTPGKKNNDDGSTSFKNSPYTHTLPVISLSADSAYIWGDSTGIYVIGKNGVTGYCNDMMKRNYCRDWERKAYMEFYDKEGIRKYAGNAGIKIHGNCSRNFPQRSLALFARSNYGNGKFEYRFFKEKNIDEFEALLLRNSGNDNRSSMIRDALMSRLASNGLNIDYQAYEPVVLYLNDRYWGIYNLREKINEHYCYDNHSANPQNIDMLESLDKIKYGDAENMDALVTFIKENPLSLHSNYLEIAERIDIGDFIHYIIAQVYCANTDWPSHNVRYWRERTSGSKWRWILFDTDLGFGLHEEGYTTDMFFRITELHENPDWITPNTVLIFMELMKSPVFREKFSQEFHRQIKNIYSDENLSRIIDEIVSALKYEIEQHCYRWDLSFTEWQREIEKIKRFAELRPSYLVKHFEEFMKKYRQIASPKP